MNVFLNSHYSRSVGFKRKWGGRKINFRSNLFPLRANVETGTTLRSGLCFLHTVSNSIIAFSLEHGNNLHQSQRNKLSTLFILPRSRTRNRDLMLVLVSFTPITHALCHFHNYLSKFASQFYDVSKHIYRQFAFSCFCEVCLHHTPPSSSSNSSSQIVHLGEGLFWRVLLRSGTIQPSSSGGLSSVVSLIASASAGRC